MSRSTMDHHARWERDRDDRQEAARQARENDTIALLGQAIADRDQALAALEEERSVRAADQLAQAFANLERAVEALAADIKAVWAEVNRETAV